MDLELSQRLDKIEKQIAELTKMQGRNFTILHNELIKTIKSEIRKIKPS